MPRPKLVLVDGHAVAFRAFHALEDANLRTNNGEPTFAVFGFLQIVLTQLQSVAPEYAAVAFDLGKTFRDDEYPEYKAGRGHAPEEFHQQLDRIKQVVAALNIPIFTAENFEADDVIGTLAAQATAHDIETYILTGDTDTLQLVDEHVRVLLSVPYRQAQEIKVYDVATVTERYKGLQPAQLTDLRGLKGDTSDNIPGVKGIGEAGAITLLLQFGTVEQIYEQLDAVPKRYQKPLGGQQAIAMLSKRLATIRRDVPVTLDLDACRLRDYNREAVLELFRELQFGRLIAKLPGLAAVAPPAPAADAPQRAVPAVPEGAAYTLTRAVPKASGAHAQDAFDLDDVFGPTTGAAPKSAAPAGAVPSAPPRPPLGNYQLVTTTEELATVVAALAAAPHFAFDTETTALDPVRAALVGISLATTPGAGWYIPVGHTTGEPQLAADAVRAALAPLLEDGARPKIGHNAKYDMHILRRWGIEVHGLAFDTMLAGQLIKQRGSLKDLAFYELNVEMTEITELLGTGKKQITFDQVPMAAALPYAAADADVTLRLHAHFAALLAQEPRRNAIFTEIEMPLVAVLADMEWAGITLDVGVLHTLSAQMSERLALLEAELTSLAGQSFNPSSSQQVSDILFGKLQLRAAGLGKVKSGHYSITADVLDKLRGEHPIIELILEHRQLSKLKSTYIDAFPALLDEHGRVHTSYNQIGSSTGRLSSQNPNLQNIPIRTEQGREIRRAFVAAPGTVLLTADYSQVELRILAHVTGDPALLAIFNESLDIHTATAARLFDVPLEEVTRNQRRLAKTVVFGVIYGISAFGLAARTDLTREQSQQMIEGLFATYPGLKSYFERTLEEGRVRGYVETLFGRRRPMPELMSANGARRQAAEREAINAPIQGTSADLIKVAMSRLHTELGRRALNSRMLLQVHDELVLEVPDDELAEVRPLVQEVMEHVYPELRVPLEVHIAAGRNWEAVE